MLKILKPLPVITLAMTVLFFSLNAKDKSYHFEFVTPEEGSAVDAESEEDYYSIKARDFSPVVRERAFIEIDTSAVKHRRVQFDPDAAEGDGFTEAEEISGKDLAAKAAIQANDFLVKNIRTVNVSGRNVNIERDCSNFVRAAYWLASGKKIDLFRESIETNSAPRNSGSGVVLLGKYFQKQQRYKTKKARVGDVIIFDDTWDKNRNRRRDDPYTHTGIVTGVRDDKTIEFVHGNVGRKIKRGYINFSQLGKYKVDGKPVNSWLRSRYSWEKDYSRNSAGHLVRAFGGFKSKNIPLSSGFAGKNHLATISK